jgi:hypothetical protein
MRIGAVMKISAFALVLILCCSYTGRAACDTPLYAICKIKLVNGASHEGMIRLHGHDCQRWMNGFRFGQAAEDPIHFFSLNFHKLSMKPNGRTEVLWRNGESWQSAGRSGLFFLQWAEYYSEQEPVTDNTKTCFMQVWNQTSKYKVLDEIIIFTELTDTLYLANPEDENYGKYKKIRFPLRQVVSLELLMTPSKKWSSYIEKKRKSNPCNTSEPCEDYEEPKWYHEVLADKEKYQYLQNEIEQNFPRKKITQASKAQQIFVLPAWSSLVLKVSR